MEDYIAVKIYPIACDRDERISLLYQIANNFYPFKLSTEALAILYRIGAIGRFALENRELGRGLYQIRMALGVSIDLSALSAKLEPQIYELGFLRDEVRYF